MLDRHAKASSITYSDISIDIRISYVREIPFLRQRLRGCPPRPHATKQKVRYLWPKFTPQHIPTKVDPTPNGPDDIIKRDAKHMALRCVNN